MSNITANPTCPCGYNLTGLPGPPWTCPECALVTPVWPPPEPGPRKLTSRELRICHITLALVLAFALAAGWIWRLTQPSPAPVKVLTLFVHLGALHIAFIRSREYAFIVPHAQGYLRFARFLSSYVKTLLLAALAVLLSALLRATLPLH